jgi:hypothetical protein
MTEEEQKAYDAGYRAAEGGLPEPDLHGSGLPFALYRAKHKGWRAAREKASIERASQEAKEFANEMTWRTIVLIGFPCVALGFVIGWIIFK